MRCSVSLRREGGEVVARCREYPELEGRAQSPAEALSRLRAAVLFWLEACPCDQTADLGLMLDVIKDGTGDRA